MPRSLRWKLLLTILPFVALAGSALFWFQYRLAKAEILAAIDANIRALSERTAGDLDRLLEQRRNDLFTLAESPLIPDFYRNVDFQLLNEAESHRRALERSFLSFAGRTGVYSRILYLDAAGREICRVENGSVKTDRIAAPPAFFQRLRRSPPGVWLVSEPEPAPGREPSVCYGKAVHDEAGRFKGAVLLRYELSQIRTILERIRPGGTGRAALLDAGGAVLAQGGAKPAGGEILSAEAPLNRMPWRISVEAPLTGFLSPLRKVRDAGALTAVAGIAGLIGIIWLAVGSATRPVAALVEASRRISAGELGHVIEEADSGELGVLSSAFNEMSRSLEANRRSNADLQAQLIQAEKLSAVGLLVSSVAHELNNPLTAVYGYCQLAQFQGAPPELQEDLEHVRQNALRAKKVVQNLLFFVRRSRSERARLDLNEAVRSALELLEYRLLKTDEVSVLPDLDPDSPEIVGDFQQIVQVLINLINNACDAMETDPGRRGEKKKIVIRTRIEDGKVFLSVQDNGRGIPANSRAAIFRPFFTTKEPGRGTGLGLSICRQIVAEHGGSISFSTEEGAGTEFTILLPPPSRDQLLALGAPPQPLELPPVPGRRILVADDEEDIAEIMARLMREDGDEVEVAVSGTEALRLARERTYDLVISDFEMEGAKGDELHAALAARTPFLLVTGDFLNPKVLHFLEAAKPDYLVKPFDLRELRQKARRLLGPH